MKACAATIVTLALVTTACVSAPATPPGAPSVSPADLVAAIADTAAGRNPSLVEAGLVLRTIEFRLLVGREEKAGAGVQILVLEAGASRAVETSFLQVFTLEIPATRGVRAAAPPAVAGVTEFVNSAMDAARDLARVAREQGLPHRLAKVELEAKIERSRSVNGGVAFTVPVAVTASVDAGGSTTSKEANTVKLIFVAAPPDR